MSALLPQSRAPAQGGGIRMSGHLANPGAAVVAPRVDHSAIHNSRLSKEEYMSKNKSKRCCTTVSAVVIPALLAVVSIGAAVAEVLGESACPTAVPGQLAPVTGRQECSIAVPIHQELAAIGREGAGRPCQGAPGC